MDKNESIRKILSFPAQDRDGNGKSRPAPHEDDEKEEEERSMEAMGLREVFALLPDGLLKAVIKQFFAAGVALFVSILLVIHFKMPQCLIGVALAGWFMWTGFSIMLDYQAGKIIERALLCVSVQKTRFQNKIRVTFRTGDEYPSFFEFFVPGKAGGFAPNIPYIIYTRESAPQILLGYQAL